MILKKDERKKTCSSVEKWINGGTWGDQSQEQVIQVTEVAATEMDKGEEI